VKPKRNDFKQRRRIDWLKKIGNRRRKRDFDLKPNRNVYSWRLRKLKTTGCRRP
jgi:hypothetical protein